MITAMKRLLVSPERRMMDPRLNIALIETREAEVARRASGERHPRWPDDGRPLAHERKQTSLHPTAVLASLLTWR
jgi:hypothetical protein